MMMRVHKEGRVKVEVGGWNDIQRLQFHDRQQEDN